MIDYITVHKDVSQNPPSADEWNELCSLHAMFKPLEQAISMLGGNDYKPISYVLPLIAYLRQQMTVNDAESEFVKCFKVAFLGHLNSMVDNYHNLEIYQLATVLDIRYKRLLSIPSENRAEVWELLKRKIREKMRESEVDVKVEPLVKKPRTSLLSLAGEVNPIAEPEEDYITEYEMYKHLPQINNDDQCPLQWWKSNEVYYPILSKLVKQYLVIPATATLCDQLFTQSREEYRRKAAALDSNNASMALCLSDWLKQQ